MRDGIHAEIGGEPSKRIVVRAPWRPKILDIHAHLPRGLGELPELELLGHLLAEARDVGLGLPATALGPGHLQIAPQGRLPA